MRSLIALLVVSACAFASPAGVDREAIVHGVRDRGHPAVAALLAPGWLCTATLVAPRVAVTAAHCLGDGADDAGELRLFFGSDLEDDGVIVDVARAEAWPGWDPEETAEGDLALLALAGDGPAAPMAMPAEPLDERFVGARVTLVGFGVTSTSRDNAGVKRRATSTVVALSADEFAFGGAGQTCHGDSGGPAFLTRDGAEVLVGVTSRGDADCSELGIDTRVDVYRDEFIDPFIAQTMVRWGGGSGDR